MGHILYDWIQLDEWSLFKCLHMSKETLKELKFFLRVTCFDTVLLPCRKDGTDLWWSISMHLQPTPLTHGQNFPGSTSNSDPLSPGCPCCGPEVLHKKGQILIFFLRRLWIFLSGVSSWSQTHLSLLSVCQKESYFLVSKEDALFLFQSLSLSFPDHMMLEDQLSCLSSHLP